MLKLEDLDRLRRRGMQLVQAARVLREVLVDLGVDPDDQRWARGRPSRDDPGGIPLERAALAAGEAFRLATTRDQGDPRGETKAPPEIVAPRWPTAALVDAEARLGIAFEAWRGALNELWSEAVKLRVPELLARWWRASRGGRVLGRRVDQGLLEGEAVWHLRRACASWDPQGGAALTTWARQPVLTALDEVARRTANPVDSPRGTRVPTAPMSALDQVTGTVYPEVLSRCRRCGGLMQPTLLRCPVCEKL